MASFYRAALLLIILVVLLFGASITFQSIFGSFITKLDGYTGHHPVFAPIIFVLLAAASVMLGPFTSVPIVPFAVSAWGIGLSLALLLLGWILGDAAAYYIGSALGYPIVKKVVSQEKLNQWIAFLSKEINVAFIFLFRLAVPSEVGYVFGVLKYNFLKYLAITLAAELPFALIVIYAGRAILESRWWTFSSLAIAGLVIIASGFYLMQKEEVQRQKN